MQGGGTNPRRDHLTNMRLLLAPALLATLAACQQNPGKAEVAPSNDVQAAAPVPSSTQPTDNSAQEIDSAPPAAEALVKRFYDLIAERRFESAAQMVATAESSQAQEHITHLQGYAQIAIDTIGSATSGEGAAGSTYIVVPVKLNATKSDATVEPISERVTLRRVNDVPGATAQQRQWHIVSIKPVEK